MTNRTRWTVTWACIGLAGYLFLNTIWTVIQAEDVWRNGELIERVNFASKWEGWRPHLAAFVAALSVLGWMWSRPEEPEQSAKPPRAWIP